MASSSRYLLHDEEIQGYFDLANDSPLGGDSSVGSNEKSLGKDGSANVAEKESALEEAAAMDAVLFIEQTEEKYRLYESTLEEHVNTCDCILKQITIKHLKGGKELKMDLLVLENLMFGRNITSLYDLKGSSSSRYNGDSGGSNKVLHDQDLLEAMPTSHIFVGNKEKWLLERAVWNDTSFLAEIDVMDYSLLVGVDDEKRELVLGIIDFMRQYTWDKCLETIIKSVGIPGGPKNAPPTVIPPMQYMKRYRKAMPAYFIVIPDQWMPAINNPRKLSSNTHEEDSQE